MDFQNQTYQNICRFTTEPDGNLKLVLTYFLPFFVCVGLIGNTLSLVTLNSGVHRHSVKTNLFLCAKSVIDCGVGVFALLFNLRINKVVLETDDYRRFYYHELQRPVLVIMNCLLMSSTWYAVAVTFERMFAIRWPLQARHAFTTNRFVVSIFVIAIISLLLTIYPLILLTNVTYVDCQRPWKKVYAVTGPLSSEQPVLWYYGFYSRLIHNLLATVVPVVLLLAFNFHLVWHLHQHRRSMARFASAGYNAQDAGEQVRVSLVVSVITVATAVFLLPSASVVVYDSINRGPKSQMYRSFVHVANFLVLCDKVLDFFLYCLVSSSFRGRLVAACFCGKLSERKKSGEIGRQRKSAQISAIRRK